MEKATLAPVPGWAQADHKSLQDSFRVYWSKAQQTFNRQGLIDLGKFRWQRALLCIGDYLLPSGRNLSFLSNATTEQASWKRLLRGTGPRVPEARKILRELWDLLDASQPLPGQLDKIIDSSAGLDFWREAVVRTPESFEFCQNQAIRFIPERQIIYLVKRSQLNGAHAELFTFCLHHNALTQFAKAGSLQPLTLLPYQSVNGTESEPHILLRFEKEARRIDFMVEFRRDTFLVRTDRASVEQFPSLEVLLSEETGLQPDESVLSKDAAPAEIESCLLKIAQVLALL